MLLLALVLASVGLAQLDTSIPPHEAYTFNNNNSQQTCLMQYQAQLDQETLQLQNAYGVFVIDAIPYLMFIGSCAIGLMLGGLF